MPAWQNCEILPSVPSHVANYLSVTTITMSELHGILRGYFGYVKSFFDYSSRSLLKMSQHKRRLSPNNELGICAPVVLTGQPGLRSTISLQGRVTGPGRSGRGDCRDGDPAANGRGGQIL